VADLHAFKTALQPSFNGRIQNTDPRVFVGGAGDDGIELLPDPLFQQYCCCGFYDLPFQFLRCIFLFGAVLCEHFQFVLLVGLGTSCHCRF
jgi:hypothetical protein